MSLGIIPRYPMPEKKPEDHEFDAAEAGLVVAMHELKKALDEGDIHAAAMAFHNAFQCCECQPHEEVEDEKQSYTPPEIE